MIFETAIPSFRFLQFGHQRHNRAGFQSPRFLQLQFRKRVMSIFGNILSHWKTSKAKVGQSESSVREAARTAVASGQITLDEARKAAVQLSSMGGLNPEQKRGRKQFLEGLTDRAGVNRSGFSYDSDNLNAADKVFVDELGNLVDQFDAEASLSTMSKEELRQAIDELADNLNKHCAEMSRRFPSAPPAPAAKSSEVDMAEVDAKSQADWDRNARDCQSLYPSFTAYAARMRYDANHPKMA